MRNYVPLIDWLVFGGLSFFASVAAGIALVTPQDWTWPARVLVFLIPATMIALSVIILLRKYRSKPDYVTRQGVLVWHGGVESMRGGPGRERLETALDFFVTTLPRLADKVGGLNQGVLADMIYGATIEWRAQPIGAVGVGWRIKDVAGLQQGKHVVLMWRGSMADSALFHELMHMVDELVYRKAPDYQHTRAGWWLLERELRQLTRL